jgi:hypothetical protein
MYSKTYEKYHTPVIMIIFFPYKYGKSQKNLSISGILSKKQINSYEVHEKSREHKLNCMLPGSKSAPDISLPEVYIAFEEHPCDFLKIGCVI